MLPGIFQTIGITELLVILGIFLLLFGASRIPSLARSLGKSAKEFKKGLQEGESETKKPGDKAQTDQETVR